jgi:hypothetical protein
MISNSCHYPLIYDVDPLKVELPRVTKAQDLLEILVLYSRLMGFKPKTPL